MFSGHDKELTAECFQRSAFSALHPLDGLWLRCFSLGESFSLFSYTCAWLLLSSRICRPECKRLLLNKRSLPGLQRGLAADIDSNFPPYRCRQGRVSPTLCCVSRVFFPFFQGPGWARGWRAKTLREHRWNPVSSGCTLTASLTARQCCAPPLMHRRAVLFMQRRWGDWGILPGCCLFHNTNWIESQLFWFDLLFAEANTAKGAPVFIRKAWSLNWGPFFLFFFNFKCSLFHVDSGKRRCAAAGAWAPVIFLSLWISMKSVVYLLYPNCFPFLEEILFALFSFFIRAKSFGTQQAVAEPLACVANQI